MGLMTLMMMRLMNDEGGVWFALGLGTGSVGGCIRVVRVQQTRWYDLGISRLFLV